MRKNEYSTRITLYSSYFDLIYQTKKLEENGIWGHLSEIKDLLFEEDPDLFLELTILRSNTGRFDLDNNVVWIIVKQNKEEIFPYFIKVLEMYFGEFIEATLIEFVNLTYKRYPISEKDFIKKYTYILEDIERKCTMKISGQ